MLVGFLAAQPAYALPAAGLDPTKRLFTYDSSGNLTEELQVSTGTRTLYAYDALNRLTELSLREGGAPEAISSFSYTYDLAGNVETLTLPNGLTTSYTYDSLNRLTRVLSLRRPTGPEAISLLDLTYTYDVSGRRTRITGTIPALTGTAPVTVAYTYDTASRLTGETRSGSSPYAMTYTYDRAGNRTEQVRDGTRTLWSVNPANQLTRIRRAGVPTQADVSVSGTTDDPDARIFINGQFAVNPGRATERWAAAVSLPEGEHTITVVAEDGLGNTRQRTVPVKVVDPTKREFSYDLNGNLAEEFSVGTGAKTRYSCDPLNRLTEVKRLAPPPWVADATSVQA